MLLANEPGLLGSVVDVRVTQQTWWSVHAEVVAWVHRWAPTEAASAPARSRARVVTEPRGQATDLSARAASLKQAAPACASSDAPCACESVDAEPAAPAAPPVAAEEARAAQEAASQPLHAAAHGGDSSVGAAHNAWAFLAAQWRVLDAVRGRPTASHCHIVVRQAQCRLSGLCAGGVRDRRLLNPWRLAVQRRALQAESSTSGRGVEGADGAGSSGGEAKSAATAAAEASRLQAQQALDQVAAAARQAASFASGVAGELFKGSPIGTRAAGSDGTKAAGAEGADASTAGPAGALLFHPLAHQRVST